MVLLSSPFPAAEHATKHPVDSDVSSLSTCSCATDSLPVLLQLQPACSARCSDHALLRHQPRIQLFHRGGSKIPNAPPLLQIFHCSRDRLTGFGSTTPTASPCSAPGRSALRCVPQRAASVSRTRGLGLCSPEQMLQIRAGDGSGATLELMPPAHHSGATTHQLVATALCANPTASCRRITLGVKGGLSHRKGNSKDDGISLTQVSEATDPYSYALAADGTRTQFADLAAPHLEPDGCAGASMPATLLGSLEICGRTSPSLVSL